jgi:hypothetical protein
MAKKTSEEEIHQEIAGAVGLEMIALLQVFVDVFFQNVCLDIHPFAL